MKIFGGRHIKSHHNFIFGIIFGIVKHKHLYILVLEIFLWDKPAGKKAFGHHDDSAKTTKVLAMNQGLYNGFLSAELLWSLMSVNFVSLAYFFLGCVAIAGVFGAITASKKSSFSKLYLR